MAWPGCVWHGPNGGLHRDGALSKRRSPRLHAQGARTLSSVLAPQPLMLPPHPLHSNALLQTLRTCLTKGGKMAGTAREKEDDGCQEGRCVVPAAEPWAGLPPRAEHHAQGPEEHEHLPLGGRGFWTELELDALAQDRRFWLGADQ